MRNDLARASQCFQRSVEISPASMMAQQNAAARYDVEHYVPADWKLADAGRLLVYDNYIPLSEDFHGQGRPADAFRYYQKARLSGSTSTPISDPAIASQRAGRALSGLRPGLADLPARLRMGDLAWPYRVS